MPRSLCPAYNGQVGHRDAGPDHRRLVADHVDAVEEVGPLGRVAYVEPVDVGPRGGTRTVRLGDQRVDPDHLVATGAELGVDGGADEARRPGQQDPGGGVLVGHAPQSANRVHRPGSTGNVQSLDQTG